MQSITLRLLGGVAQLQVDPHTPGADFRIAVVGPLTSLVVGLFGVFAAVAVMLDANRMFNRPAGLPGRYQTSCWLHSTCCRRLRWTGAAFSGRL
ncbi:MAG: hypothetical protein ACRDQD_07780 [Nocardioidaceae bacterium]